MLVVWVFSKGKQVVQEEAAFPGDCSISWSWVSSYKGSGGSYVDVKWFYSSSLFLCIAESCGGRGNQQSTKPEVCERWP